MAEKKKILYIVEAMGGGVFTYIVDLANELVNKYDMYIAYPYLEIILVDDGSTDNSGKICDSYTAKDKRVKVIHKQNQGVSLARNAALDVATGKWVCFVDGDDYVMPNYVSYMLALALAYNADIALTTQMFGNFDSNKQAKNDSVKAWTAEDR